MNLILRNRNYFILIICFIFFFLACLDCCAAENSPLLENSSNQYGHTLHSDGDEVLDIGEAGHESRISSESFAVSQDSFSINTKHRKLKNTLSNFLFEGDNSFDKSALIIYTLKDTREGRSWDNPSVFMRSMDEEILNKTRSWKVLLSGVAGGLIGIIVPGTPLTGSILWGVGNALHIPVSKGVSDAIVSEIMITMSPVFARQFYTRSQIIMSSFLGETAFQTGEEGDDKPHVYDPLWWHTALKFMVSIGAAVEGTFYWGIVYTAEAKGWENISLGMGWGLALALAERYYTVGTRSIDRILVRYWYDSEIVHQQRMALIGQTRRALLEIEKSDKFVEEIYRIAQREMHINLDAKLGDINPEHYFAMSALILRHETSSDEKGPSSLGKNESKLEEEINGLSENISKLQTFRVLTDRMTPSAKEAFMEYLSVFLTGAGAYSRLLGRQYILELVLEHILSLDSATSATAAWWLAGVDVTTRTILESGVQQDYMKGWLNSFSLKHLVDFQHLRKGAGWISFLNGGWFALANAVATLSKFKEMTVPIPFQILTIIPGFIIDQGYISNYSDEHVNELITSSATLRNRETITLTEKRAWCHEWTKKLLSFLKIANSEGVSVFFNKTQRAL